MDLEDLRLAVFGSFVTTGRAPTPQELAQLRQGSSSIGRTGVKATRAELTIEPRNSRAAL